MGFTIPLVFSILLAYFFVIAVAKILLEFSSLLFLCSIVGVTFFEPSIFVCLLMFLYSVL